MKKLLRVLVIAALLVALAIPCLADYETTQPVTCDHAGTEYTESQKPTCETKGLMSGVCPKCSDTVTYTTPALGHAWDEGKVTTEANCGNDGVKTYTCTREGCGKTKTEVITASGEHKWNDGEVTTEATCGKAGVKTFTCTVCNETKTEEIPITDHDYQDGVCTICGKPQTYVRVNANGVENPNGAYIKMGKTYCEQVKDGELENALMEIAGSPYLTEYANWTPFDFGNGDSGENATTYYCDVEYNGLNYRGVCIKESRKDNDNTQTTSSRYWTGTYWFEQRDAMWRIVKEEDGKAYLVSKEIWISQRFAESDEGELTYENSWIRNWLINTWINELFTPEQQAILQGNEACFGDKIFLPSSDEISINSPKPFGLYKYPFCLGAYKEVLQGYGDNYCPYWLRDGIVKGEDGKNYVKCVTSCPPFDQTTEYLATKTFVGVVPAIIIEL